MDKMLSFLAENSKNENTAIKEKLRKMQIVDKRSRQMR